MTTLSGWGRYPRLDTNLQRLATPQDALRLAHALQGYVARGNGRSYGDAAIGEHATLQVLGLDRMRSFDPATGRLTVEAGVLLGDIIAAFGPRGFFPSVVPGTKFVTVGGAIAADVHGKNHHRDGGFGATIEDLRLVLPSGEVAVVSRTQNPALFHATIGGMGLTGTITEATMLLRRIETGWMKQTTVVAANLDAAIEALNGSDDATYSVAWIDVVAKGAGHGRSLIYIGEHASRADVAAAVPAPPGHFTPARHPRLSVPFDLPGFTLNPWSVAAFNELYFRNGSRKAGVPDLVHWNPYFFPLDGIGHWNRIYGAGGFVQHQCVIPIAKARDTIAEILARTAQRGDASFLAVLKKLGAGSGLMSFPMPGLTLTLDFKMSASLPRFLVEIDKIVADSGGRIYLAKDALQSRPTFEAGYPALGAFRALRHDIGATTKILSKQSMRLGV
jgi:decaprenylphospho-beta-D-ribofuranose 2-oxidase